MAACTAVHKRLPEHDMVAPGDSGRDSGGGVGGQAAMPQRSISAVARSTHAMLNTCACAYVYIRLMLNTCACAPQFFHVPSALPEHGRQSHERSLASPRHLDLAAPVAR